VGSTLAGYRLDAVLGRGGMGVVYRAEHLTLHRRVALKLVAPELAADPRFRERFLAESRLAASLEHPNVIPIYDAGEADRQLYLAMRLVEGQSLRELLAEQAPLPPARAIDLLAPVASALDTAHGRGLVHRDVKPANILLEAANQAEHVYLTDFGLARLAGEGRPAEMTHLSGSFHYVAPEQVTEHTVDPRADQYALACVLYECLTGEPPYRESSPMTLLWAHASEPPPNASEGNTQLPKAIDSVITRALAKEPGERYQTCSALATAAAEALGVGLTPAKVSRRRLLLLAAAGALTVAAATGVPAIVLFRGGEQGGEMDGSRPTTLITRDSLQRIDPDTNELVATIPFGLSGRKPYSIGELAVGEGAIWVIDRLLNTLNRIDASTNTVSATFAFTVPNAHVMNPAVIKVGLGRVWITAGGTAMLRIDPRNGRATLVRIPGADTVWLESLAHGAVWAWTDSGAELWRIDAKTGEAVRAGAFGAADDFFNLTPQPSVPAGEMWWDSNNVPGFFHVYDLATGKRLATFDPIHVWINTIAPTAGSHIAGFAQAHGRGWVSNRWDDTVLQLDPSTNVTREVHVGRDPAGIAFGAGSIWVSNSGDGTVSRIDPATRQILDTIEVGGRPQSAAVGLGSVWVSVYPA
jgi:YVTN family beta-propeller protein